MSVKLQPNMTQNARDLKICEDYWAYDNKGDYIAHVETICEKYEISPQLFFETIGECFAYLDDVMRILWLCVPFTDTSRHSVYAGKRQLVL